MSQPARRAAIYAKQRPTGQLPNQVGALAHSERVDQISYGRLIQSHRCVLLGVHLVGTHRASRRWLTPWWTGTETPPPEGTHTTEIDHRINWTTTHHTRLDELDPLRNYHHQQKHHHGWALTNGNGPRPFVPPDNPQHPGCHPPTARRPTGRAPGRPRGALLGAGLRGRHPDRG